MLAEFKIINDPLRPSVSTNLCSVCYRNNMNNNKKIGCCSYQPEFCLFDLVFLYLHYPDIYELILNKGQIIKGYNGTMIEMKSDLNQCPFITDQGCILPKDAITPLCRLYICREAAIFAPAIVEARFDEYFTSKEYELNHYLNAQLSCDQGPTQTKLHDFIVEVSQTISNILKDINRNDAPTEIYSKEIKIEDFGKIS